jgi:hypothetical protein
MPDELTPAMPKLVTSSEERLREVIEQVGTWKGTLIGTAVMPLGWNTWRCVRERPAGMLGSVACVTHKAPRRFVPSCARTSSSVTLLEHAGSGRSRRR